MSSSNIAPSKFGGRGYMNMNAANYGKPLKGLKLNIVIGGLVCIGSMVGIHCLFNSEIKSHNVQLPLSDKKSLGMSFLQVLSSFSGPQPLEQQPPCSAPSSAYQRLPRSGGPPSYQHSLAESAFMSQRHPSTSAGGASTSADLVYRASQEAPPLPCPDVDEEAGQKSTQRCCRNCGVLCRDSCCGIITHCKKTNCCHMDQCCSLGRAAVSCSMQACDSCCKQAAPHVTTACDIACKALGSCCKQAAPHVTTACDIACKAFGSCCASIMDMWIGDRDLNALLTATQDLFMKAGPEHGGKRKNDSGINGDKIGFQNRLDEIVDHLRKLHQRGFQAETIENAINDKEERFINVINVSGLSFRVLYDKIGNNEHFQLKREDLDFTDAWTKLRQRQVVVAKDAPGPDAAAAHAPGGAGSESLLLLADQKPLSTVISMINTICDKAGKFHGPWGNDPNMTAPADDPDFWTGIWDNLVNGLNQSSKKIGATRTAEALRYIFTYAPHECDRRGIFFIKRVEENREYGNFEAFCKRCKQDHPPKISEFNFIK